MAARLRRTTPASAQTRTPINPAVVGSGTCDKLNWPELSVYKLSARMKVIVGSTSLKAGKPSAESVVKGSVRLKGGLPLPNPSAASAGKICTVLVPEISIRSAPKSQVPVVPPNVPEKVVASPTGEVPATVTTPAPLTQ